MSINYRPVLPTGLLESREQGDANFGKRVGMDFSLKNGVVLEILEIDDDRNQSKLVPEYNVMVVESNNTAIYKNVISIDVFGGNADYQQTKYRTPDDPKAVQDSGSLKDQNGSIVLILCLDGSAEKGVIVGSIAHPSLDPVLTKEKGHHLEGEFNGINYEINKDGEFTLTYKSSTTNDGTPADEEAGGTSVKIAKDGTVEISTGNDETIKLDKTGKNINVSAGNDITTDSKNNTDLTVGANLNAKITSDLLLEAGGQAAMTIGSQFQLEAKSQVVVKSPMVQVDSSAMVKIKTNVLDLSGNLILVGGPSAVLPALLPTTQYLGTSPFLGLPVVTSAIGPFSSKVLLAP